MISLVSWLLALSPRHSPAQRMVWQEWEYHIGLGNQLQLQSDVSLRHFLPSDRQQFFGRTSFGWGNDQFFLGLGFLATDRDLAYSDAWERRVFAKAQLSFPTRIGHWSHIVRPEWSQMGTQHNFRFRYQQSLRRPVAWLGKDMAWLLAEEIVLDLKMSPFGMNRIGLGLEQSLSQNLKLQLHYIFQMSEGKHPQEIEQLHILRIQFKLKHAYSKH